MCAFFRCDEEILTGSIHCEFHTCKHKISQKELERKKEEEERDKFKNQTNNKPTSKRLRPDVEPQHSIAKSESPDEILHDETICEKPAHDGGMFCISHTCKFCVHDDTLSGYCDRHSCIECKDPTRVANGYCDEHACDNEYGCTNIKTKNSKYCIEHKCQTCVRRAVNSSKFCTMHVCAYEMCTDQLETNSDYCSRHKCASCNTVVSEDGQFCKNHTCVVSHCNGEKHKPYKWCISHVCHACDDFAGRMFIDRPACDTHFGVCVDCLVKSAAKSIQRCTPCHKTHEIAVSLADATAKMADATQKLNVVEMELAETKKNASYGKDAIEQVEALRVDTKKNITDAQKIINYTAQEAESARVAADIATERTEKTENLMNDTNAKTDELGARVENTEEELDEIKRKRKW